MRNLVLVALLLLPGLASAGERWMAPPLGQLAEARRPPQGRISMGEAMEVVQRTTGGRVLQAQPATVNGHEGYRIKVLTSRGEVRVVHVDAVTGAMQ